VLVKIPFGLEVTISLGEEIFFNRRLGWRVSKIRSSKKLDIGALQLVFLLG